MDITHNATREMVEKAIAIKLGLNPHTVTNLYIEVDPDKKTVQVDYTGTAYMHLDIFQQILNNTAKENA